MLTTPTPDPLHDWITSCEILYNLDDFITLHNDHAITDLFLGCLHPHARHTLVNVLMEEFLLEAHTDNPHWGDRGDTLHRRLRQETAWLNHIYGDSHD